MSHSLCTLRRSVFRRAHRARHDAARGEDGGGRGAVGPRHRRRLRPLRRGRRRKALEQGGFLVWVQIEKIGKSSQVPAAPSNFKLNAFLLAASY